MKKYIPKEDKEKRKKEQRTDGIKKNSKMLDFNLILWTIVRNGLKLQIKDRDYQTEL